MNRLPEIIILNGTAPLPHSDVKLQCLVSMGASDHLQRDLKDTLPLPYKQMHAMCSFMLSKKLPLSLHPWMLHRYEENSVFHTISDYWVKRNYQPPVTHSSLTVQTLFQKHCFIPNVS